MDQAIQYILRNIFGKELPLLTYKRYSTANRKEEMTQTKDFSQLLSAVVPNLDEDLTAYALSYLRDPDGAGSSPSDVVDFLGPILETEDLPQSSILSVCTEVAQLMASLNPSLSQQTNQTKSSSGLTILQTEIRMSGLTSNTLTFTQLKKVDIRHGGSKTVESQVDQRKLRLAEKKLAEKRAARGVIDEREVPVWNPSVKPSIVVNQMRPSTQAMESRSKDIKLENFDIAFAGNPILQNANMTLNFGGRYGLVGKNGVGKSTLLRAMAMKELFIPPHIRVLHVEQEIHGDDTRAIDSVLQADEEMQSLLAEEKTISVKLNRSSTTPEEMNNLNARLKVVYQLLQDMESDKAESRASAILHGLGFATDLQQAATSTFSGGWRMRLALARALFCRPDLLLADEVTNYLDFPAVVWLENYFQNWATTLLVVSHDRSFLDAVSTDILHLHDGELDHYRGNFTTFLATKSEKRKNQWREYESQLQYRAHLQAFIDRWRYNAKRAAQAQSKIKVLEKLGPLIAPPKDDMDGMGGDSGQEANVYFTFPVPENLSPPILQADEVVFGYNEQRIILNNVSFDLRMDSKIAIVGPNGAGKSTLIKLLTGNVEPQKGRIFRHGRLRIALFSQHHVDQLELGLSSVQFLASLFPGQPEESYRRVLGRFGLTGMTALQPIGTLSGGQKSRTVFAWMAMSQPHILVLDEPTNIRGHVTDHLDMDSIEALSKALVSYQGGLLIVSHDQEFLDAVCSEVWVCFEGGLDKFEGKAGAPGGVVWQYKQSLLSSA